MTVTHLPISRVNFMPCQFHGYFPRVFSQYFSLKFSIKLMRNLECGQIKDDTCQFHLSISCLLSISWVFPTRIFTEFSIKLMRNLESRPHQRWRLHICQFHVSISMPCQFHGYLYTLVNEKSCVFIKLMINYLCLSLFEERGSPGSIFTGFLIKIIERYAGPYMLIPISFHTISH